MKNLSEGEQEKSRMLSKLFGVFCLLISNMTFMLYVNEVWTSIFLHHMKIAG